MIQTLLITFLTLLRVAFVGDPQVDNEQELDYARRSIYSELRARSDLDLVVVLGDLVNEKPELIIPSEAILDSLGCPWARVNGNHDGPAPTKDTVLHRGNVHFILVDNVRRTRKGYEGGLGRGQKQWLDSLVRTIPERDRIIMCGHVPFSQCRGRDSLSNILAGHGSVLLVCGHTHSVDRHVVERGVEEVLAGASCGSWWRGVKDAAGIPDARMNCGAPRGYFVADIRTSSRSDKWYSLQYKAVGSDSVASAFLRDGHLSVNVFGGSREGVVQVKAAKGGWKTLQHRYEIAPEVADIIASNAAQSRQYRKEHRDEFIPARRRPSPHVWSAPVPDIAAGTASESVFSSGNTIRLRYSDSAMRFSTRCEVR